MRRIVLLAALALIACDKRTPAASQATSTVQQGPGFVVTASTPPTKSHVDAENGARARDVYTYAQGEVWVIDLGANPDPSRTVLTMRDKISFTSQMIRSEDKVSVGAAEGLDLKYVTSDDGGQYGRSRIVATDKTAYHVRAVGREPVVDAFVESFALK